MSHEVAHPAMGFRIWKVQVARNELGRFLNFEGRPFTYPQSISPYMTSPVKDEAGSDSEGFPWMATTWHARTKHAICLDEYRKHPTSNSPSESCPCGLYAFHTVECAVGMLVGEQLTWRQTLGPRTEVTVVGAVLGRGDVLLHNHGWRSEEMELVALADFGPLLDRATAKQIAKQLRIPCVPIAKLREAAVSRGGHLLEPKLFEERLEPIPTFPSLEPIPNTSQKVCDARSVDAAERIGFKAFKLFEPSQFRRRNWLGDDLKSYLGRLPVQLVSVWSSHHLLARGEEHPAVYWNSKEKVAECVMNPDHHAPKLWCECGIHAFRRLNTAYELATDILLRAIPQDRQVLSSVVGAVSARGKMIFNDDGWRSEEAKLIALSLPESTASPTATRAIEEIGQTLDVPVVRLDRLVRFAHQRARRLELA